MKKMEGSVRSGGVLKKKSSSGCLIIKKKGDNNNSGGGLGVLSDDTKEKKRGRLVESSSGSSDEDESLEIMRRKVNEKRLNNGSTGYKRNELENRDYDRINNAGIEISAEKKRSRLDLFEFDEYDEFDGKKMRNDYLEDRFKAGSHSDKSLKKEFGIGSSNRKQSSYFDGSSSGRNKRVELEVDEAQLPISLLRLKYQETANEPIRLQGKNGVLKVMVNKKKKMGLHSQPKNYDHRDLKERRGPTADNVVKKKLLARPENRGLLIDKEKSVEKEKKEKKLEKGKPILDIGTSKAKDSEIDGMDTVLKLAPPLPQACSTKKGMKKEKEKTPPPEILTPKGKEANEGKAKRGGSTEKQMLREKIRGMLIDAGWTIDYRPRRNRDYLDAVYINPSGTAYWSIIKAYDAFKRQLEEDNDGQAKPDVASPSVATLSEDLVNKLTRQTKKKIEQEMKRKRKEEGMTKIAKKPAVRESSDSDENDDRLSSYMKQNYKSRRGKVCKVDRDSDDDMIDDSSRRKTASKPSFIQGRTSKIIGRCTLLVRGSVKGENSDSDGYIPYSGKRTVLAWLIDCGTARLSEKVQYMNRRRTRVMLEGWITRDGIHCGCCSKILSVSKFELHAGSKLRQPFQNIFLESGSSLLQCQIDAWNSQEESVRRDFHTVDVDGDDPDDDTCGICGDGGDLICCDSCPSTFHQICLEIKMLPSGDWHCPNCTCKFCGFASGNVAKANDSAGDELHECSFCEKKYHKSCSEKMQVVTVSANGASFCGLKCQELYAHLQKNLGVKHELEAGFSWSLIQRTDISDPSVRGFPQRVECNSKLAVALSVMDECFLPIVDRRSGINMLHNVVYNCGSNFNRLNYRGFYTVILERGDEIISAASIRLHGARLAEMPFIGTREIYRRQGMCRRLFSAIETELCSLKVGQLIIPAISEHMNTWTTVFDFHELEDIHRKEIKSMNMLVFPGTDMLQKQLLKQENSDGFKVSEYPKSPPQLPVIVKTSNIRPSLEENGHEPKTKEEKLDPLDSGVPAPDHNTGDSSSDPRSKDNTNSSVETTVSNSCEIEAPLLESIQDSSGKTLEVSKDSDSMKISNNGCLESPPPSKVNGKPYPESYPTTVVHDDDSNDAKVDYAKGNLDHTRIQNTNDNDGCDPRKASVMDADENINENQNPTSISASPEAELDDRKVFLHVEGDFVGPSVVEGSVDQSDIVGPSTVRETDESENDKADGRKEVASPISSS